MNALLVIGKGLLFVLLASLVVVAIVKWGVLGILLAIIAAVVFAAIAVRGDDSRTRNERPGHDWHEV